MAIAPPSAINPILRKIPKTNRMDEAIKPPKFQSEVFIKLIIITITEIIHPDTKPINIVLTVNTSRYSLLFK